MAVVPSFFRTAPRSSSPDTPDCVGKSGFILIFLLGFVIRLAACQNAHIINPDGVYYIHQARAIYYGEWNGLTSCALSFVSMYPFFIAGGYALIHDWATAAQWISCVFGSLTLIPLHLLCRRFFNRDISFLTLLVFALIPVFVAGSANVVRGPLCWFFLALGLYFFVVSNERNSRLFLTLSCLAFIAASWARIESAVLVAVSLIYLLVVPQEERFKKTACFALPLILILSVVFFTGILLDRPLIHMLRLNEIVDKLSGPMVAYETLRDGLRELMRQPLDGVMPHFLHKARNMVWLVALGTLVRYMLRAYFYFFFIFFLLGLGDVSRRLREDPRISYLSFLFLSAFLLLYMHVIQTWMMFDRFWAIFMLPGFVVVGFGVQKGVLLLNTRCRLKISTALLLVSFLILACTLPKDLQPRETDKVVYREIGSFIAEMEGNDKEIRILKSLRTPNWIPFYANINYEGVSCPKIDFGMDEALFEERVFKDYDTLIRYLGEGEIDYFLWEEKAWPEGTFNLSATQHLKDLETIRAWHHPDMGKMVLYKVVLTHKR